MKGEGENSGPAIRIIPRLDIKGPNLVKGIHLEGLRVLGKPERFAEYYYNEGADELLFMDAVASLYGRNALLDIIQQTSRKQFIPLTVGGGIRSIEDIRKILNAGADKVSLNTAAIQRPEFIQEAARRFGSSTIVISIEAIQQKGGGYEAYTDNGREKTGLDAVGWAKKAEELGAGEILVTSIDREGTGKGLDISLTREISNCLSIPVVACGGAGKLEHIFQAISEGGVRAVCLASILHYHFIQHHAMDDLFDEEINTEALRSRRGFLKVEDAGIRDIKSFLIGRDLQCRPSLEAIEYE